MLRESYCSWAWDDDPGFYICVFGSGTPSFDTYSKSLGYFQSSANADSADTTFCTKLIQSPLLISLQLLPLSRHLTDCPQTISLEFDPEDKSVPLILVDPTQLAKLERTFRNSPPSSLSRF